MWSNNLNGGNEASTSNQQRVVYTSMQSTIFGQTAMPSQNVVPISDPNVDSMSGIGSLLNIIENMSGEMKNLSFEHSDIFNNFNKPNNN